MIGTAAAQQDFLSQFSEGLEALAKDGAQHALSGKGIVVSAGGSSVFTNAYVLIHLLRRHLNCKLPIEVWHFGPEELSPRMQNLLRELDVHPVDANDVITKFAAPIQDGWQLKAFAALRSGFAEVILLDADQVPAVDPAVAFSWPEYTSSGAVFWQDRVDLRADNPIWNLVGLAPRRIRSFESGQVVIDKRRHWRALAATFLLNAAAERIYQLVYGDKDTFLLGWLLTNSAYSLVPYSPFVDAGALMQRDFSGAIFLQHRTNAKWNYAGDQVWPQQVLHREASLAALGILRQKWNGRIFIPPGRSAAARQLEEQIIAAGCFTFEHPGGVSFEIEFLPDGEIGKGRETGRQNWAVVDDDGTSGGLKLVVFFHNAPSYWVRPSANGLWEGERLIISAAPVIARASGPVRAPNTSNRTLVDDLLQAADMADPDSPHAAGLAKALALLTRIEPDVVQRLKTLAAREPQGSALAKRLALLANELASMPLASNKPVLKNGQVLRDGYTA